MTKMTTQAECSRSCDDLAICETFTFLQNTNVCSLYSLDPKAQIGLNTNPNTNPRQSLINS